MNHKKICVVLLILAVTLLSGCSLRTVDQLYCLPKRSDDYMNLQSAINKAMGGMNYSAPVSGENQQTVQMADLDGDGSAEYLLFAKDNSEKPLHILIFGRTDDKYILLDSISCAGSAFEQVDYVKMDDRGGADLVVGRKVGDQVLRTVSVYSMVSGKMVQTMATNYSKYVCTDLDMDGLSEVMVLRPNENEASHGTAKLYSMKNGEMMAYEGTDMSAAASGIKRIMISRLQDGLPAVYVASELDGTSVVTDVFAVKDGSFCNIASLSDMHTDVDMLRNFAVYADDIDDDGVLELPSLVCTHNPNEGEPDNHHLIRWYALRSDGTSMEKMFTFHNYGGGWYVRLDSATMRGMTVVQKGNSFEFSVLNSQTNTLDKIMNIYVLTGEAREEQAVSNNRFVLYRTESTVYAAHLEVASAAYNMSKDSLISNFHLIQQDWKTGET